MTQTTIVNQLKPLISIVFQSMTAQLQQMVTQTQLTQMIYQMVLQRETVSEARINPTELQSQTSWVDIS